MHLAAVAFLVHEYDQAIAYFTRSLGFRLVEDTRLSDTKRWVIVSPGSAGGTSLLLARAADDAQRACVGRQGGGRVAFFLHTHDFDRDHARLLAAGVDFLEPPRRETYGTVAVFRDLYGNKWDLIGPMRDESPAR
jgi:catechol 2,3-dioxygenase-like lactoylglutathione lyase family enzyme